MIRVCLSAPFCPQLCHSSRFTCWPEVWIVPIDGSAANEAAIKSYNAEHGTAIAIRKVKYLNNIVEQDHRGVKRVTRPMLGFKSFEAAQDTLVGIELMHMIKKRQMIMETEDEGLTAAELFYSLAA
jgi:putative transposase